MKPPFVRDQGQHWDLLFGGGTAIAGELAEEAAQLRFETAELMGAFVDTATGRHDPLAASAYAHAISGAAEQSAKWWRKHDDVDVEAVVDYLVNLLWNGLERQVSQRP